MIVFSSLFLVQCKPKSPKEDSIIMKSVSGGLTKITGHIHNRSVYPNTKDVTVNELTFQKYSPKLWESTSYHYLCCMVWPMLASCGTTRNDYERIYC